MCFDYTSMQSVHALQSHIHYFSQWIISILPEEFRAVHFKAALMDLYNMIICSNS